MLSAFLAIYSTSSGSAILIASKGEGYLTMVQLAFKDANTMTSSQKLEQGLMLLCSAPGQHMLIGTVRVKAEAEPGGVPSHQFEAVFCHGL